ncbi:MAG: MoaD/ThiS family protein [Saprospiraceae bacterium]
MKIKCFGRISDIITSEWELEKEMSTWFELKKALIKKYPLLEYEVFTIAINQQMYNGNEDIALNHNDEIALMPPFSGG